MKTIIWPVYLDSTHTRSQGRKLSKEESISEPKIREISSALKKLRMEFDIDRSKSYPGSWWEKSGRIVVEQEGKTKLELLRAIASQIKKARV